MAVPFVMGVGGSFDVVVGGDKKGSGMDATDWVRMVLPVFM